MERMQPRGPIRRFIRQSVLSAFILYAWSIRHLKFLHFTLPPNLRELTRAWDWRVTFLYVFSFGRRFYMDQPCTMRDPPAWRPKVQTDPQYQFTEEDIRRFYEKGYIGPLTMFTPEEMKAFRPKIDAVLERPAAIYDMGESTHSGLDVSGQGRDRHLDCPEVWEMISHPAIVERLAQLLGPDLILWRSQVFCKNAGGAAVKWHQASTYMNELLYKATLEPVDRNDLFQLTTWIAIDDANLENGCMQFEIGTHRRMEVIKVAAGRNEQTLEAQYSFAREVDLSRVETVECRAGQFIIFTERCVHGSPANTSDRRCLGMAFRTLPPSVQVYRGQTEHGVSYFKQGQFSLDNWGAVQLRDEDRHHLNRMRTPAVAQEDKSAVAGAA
ncbi:MAG: phytanoyl-CoA dioxygenase family protein [Phycisphaerae bacterium]